MSEDFLQGQIDRRSVAVVFRRENPGRRKLPQFAKRNPDGARGYLGKNFLNRDEDFRFAHVEDAHALHQVGGKAHDDGLERHADIRRGVAGPRHGRRLGIHADGFGRATLHVGSLRGRIKFTGRIQGGAAAAAEKICEGC